MIRRRRPAEPQTTAEGHRIINSRFGRFWFDPVERVFREVEDDARTAQRIEDLNREQRRVLAGSGSNWSPWG